MSTVTLTEEQINTIVEQVSNKITSKLDEIRSQILMSITTQITELSIQVVSQEKRINLIVDQYSKKNPISIEKSLSKKKITVDENNGEKASKSTIFVAPLTPVVVTPSISVANTTTTTTTTPAPTIVKATTKTTKKDTKTVTKQKQTREAYFKHSYENNEEFRNKYTPEADKQSLDTDPEVAKKRKVETKNKAKAEKLWVRYYSETSSNNQHRDIFNIDFENSNKVINVEPVENVQLEVEPRTDIDD